jgi:hypothetical protein
LLGIWLKVGVREEKNMKQNMKQNMKKAAAFNISERHPADLNRLK